MNSRLENRVSVFLYKLFIALLISLVWGREVASRLPRSSDAMNEKIKQNSVAISKPFVMGRIAKVP